MAQRKSSRSNGRADQKRHVPRNDLPVDVPYLAEDLGHALDVDGEPAAVDFRALRTDPEIRQLAISVWSQFQAGKSMERHAQQMDAEGVAFGDLWAPGITTSLTTSSTLEEINTYRKQLLFRATFLEAILTQTLSELEAIERTINNKQDKRD